MCSTISNGSKTASGVIRRSDTSTLLSSSARWDQLNRVSIKPAAARLPRRDASVPPPRTIQLRLGRALAVRRSSSLSRFRSVDKGKEDWLWRRPTRKWVVTATDSRDMAHPFLSRTSPKNRPKPSPNAASTKAALTTRARVAVLLGTSKRIAYRAAKHRLGVRLTAASE